VFRVEHKESGQKVAMKAMKKSFLIMNNQIKYAVSEAQIMKDLNHPYLLNLLSTF